MNNYSTSRIAAGALMTLVCVVIGSAGVMAADETIKHVDQHFNGDRVVGGVTLHFVGMNPLTQTATFDVAATIVTPPPLPSGFSNTSAATVPTPTPPKKAQNGIVALDGGFLNCDREASKLPPQDFYDCSIAATQWADDIHGTLEKLLTDAEKQVVDFRTASDRKVAGSAAIDDGTKLQDYRNDVATLIAGSTAIDTAVRAIGVWPRAQAENARLGIARFASTVDKVVLPPAVKNALKAKLDSATSEVDDAARKSYESRRQALIDARDRILTLSPQSYIQDFQAPCSGLFGKGLERKVTVKLVPIDPKSGAATVTDDVTTICPTSSFVSTGFTFAWGGSRTFGTVAQNSAVVPAAAATSAPNVIVETTHSDVRPASISFMNFRVGGSKRSEDGIYASLGVIVGTGSNSNVDFAGGLSYAFARSFVLTAGGFVGSQTQLAPGYTLGGLVPASVTNPPTTTTRTIKPFVGVSFNL